MANRQERRAQKRQEGSAIERAVQAVAGAEQDPIAFAREFREMQEATKAAYALIFNLVKQLGGGPMTISRVDMLIPKNQHLVLKQDAEGNVHLSIDTDR